MCFYKDDEYPVFCKAGAIVPLSLDNTIDNPKDMEVVVFPFANNSYIMYEDDGITNNYLKGEAMFTRFDFKYEKDNYLFGIVSSGKCNIVPERNYKIRFKNTLNITDVTVLYNNKPVDTKVSYDRDDFVVEVQNIVSGGQLVINVKGKEILQEAIQLINEDIREILNDLEIETTLKVKIDEILFSDKSIKEKRIAIKKLKLEPKFVNMFIKLLEYISNV